ncbi:MAG: outer membrane protein [Bauldia sp.]
MCRWTAAPFFGITTGAQKQIGNFVLGVENDFQWSWIGAGPVLLNVLDEDGEFLELPDPERFVESSLDWFGTARLRAGFALDRALIYVTGGLAYGHRTNTFSDFRKRILTAPSIFNGTETETSIGWALGGGLEFAISDHASIKGEYLHMSSSRPKWRSPMRRTRLPGSAAARYPSAPSASASTSTSSLPRDAEGKGWLAPALSFGAAGEDPHRGRLVLGSARSAHGCR